MRCVVLLLFVLVLGVLSSDLEAIDSVSSFLALKKEIVKADNNNFVIYWSNEFIHGYRLATLEDITTQAFVDEYNNGGIYFNISDGGIAPLLKCTLAVTEGVLLFPKNDTHNANLLTLYDADGNSGCDLYMDSGNGHFESWPDNFCVSTYNGNQFPSLSVSFMKGNFYTQTEYCEAGVKTTNMAIFVRDSITLTPTLAPPPPLRQLLRQAMCVVGILIYLWFLSIF